MKHYSAFDLEHGRLRLRQGKPIEPELAAALLGEGIETTGWMYRYRGYSRYVEGGQTVFPMTPEALP